MDGAIEILAPSPPRLDQTRSSDPIRGLAEPTASSAPIAGRSWEFDSKVNSSSWHHSRLVCTQCALAPALHGVHADAPMDTEARQRAHRQRDWAEIEVRRHIEATHADMPLDERVRRVRDFSMHGGQLMRRPTLGK